MKTLSITNDAGRNFEVRLIQPGMTYGTNNKAINDYNEAIVEFVDTSAKTPQSVSTYYRSTLLEREPGRGLCLDGAYPVEWSVTAQNMNEVIAWLK